MKWQITEDAIIAFSIPENAEQILSDKPENFDDFHRLDLKEAKTVKLSLRRLKLILKQIEKAEKEKDEDKEISVSFTVQNDYPVLIKTRNLSFVLAPRVD